MNEDLNRDISDAKTGKNLEGLAASHPSATKEHLDKLAGDEEPLVREAAARHSNYIKSKIKKSIEKIEPKLESGMSLNDLKKSQAQYDFIQSKIEKVLNKNDPELILAVFDKIKHFNK